ncbi:MAG: hypothetical protein WC058_16225 [Phycisphaeraceae bacterium]
MALIETIPTKEDYRRKMAYKLMTEAADPTVPVNHWAQGLAKLGQGALGGYEMYQADQKDKETEGNQNSAMIKALEMWGGGSPSAPSAQPTPQQPTAQPPAPVSSVTPSAGAVPAVLSGGAPSVPDGQVVPRTATNPNGGMYGGLNWRPVDSEPQPEPTKTAALSPMVPTPVKTETVQPTPAIPTPTDPQRQVATARLAEMLRSDNPQIRYAGRELAQKFVASEMQRQFKPAEWDFKQTSDGSYIAINKANPGIVQPVPGSGGGQGAIDFEAKKAGAIEQSKRVGSVEYEAGKAGAIEKAKALATREIAKPDQDKQNQKVGTIVTQDIDRAIGKIDSGILPTTGGAGNLLASVPGTQAHDVSKLLETVKSNSGFQELAKMRAASPTGAALGSVTERELALLQSTIGNLEQSQSADQLKDNLRRVKNTYLDIIHGEGKGPSREKLTFQEKANQPKTTKSGVKWSVE